jgi:hypothetical protein
MSQGDGCWGGGGGIWSRSLVVVGATLGVFGVHTLLTRVEGSLRAFRGCLKVEVKFSCRFSESLSVVVVTNGVSYTVSRLPCEWPPTPRKVGSNIFQIPPQRRKPIERDLKSQATRSCVHYRFQF